MPSRAAVKREPGPATRGTLSASQPLKGYTTLSGRVLRFFDFDQRAAKVFRTTIPPNAYSTMAPLFSPRIGIHGCCLRGLRRARTFRNSTNAAKAMDE